MRSLLFLLAVFLVSAIFAQEYPLPHVHQEPVFDTAPRFPGGSNAMMRFFADSIRYPQPERSQRKQGHVLVKFNVNEIGEVIDIHVVNGVAGAPNFVNETLRVLASMPKWDPATKNGKCVTANVQVSVPFRLRR